MDVLKNKHFYIPFIAIILIAFIFLLAQIPLAKVEPKHLPIGIVNEDAGAMGDNIYSALLANAPEQVKFIEYETKSRLVDAMNDKQVYGGLLIPTEFSGDFASLQSLAPKQATMEIYINEGYNSNVAMVLETMLPAIVDNISGNVADQMLSRMAAMNPDIGSNITEQITEMFSSFQSLIMQSLRDPGALHQMISERIGNLVKELPNLNVDHLKIMADPIKSEIIKVNPVGGLGSVPGALFITVWIASLLGALLFYFAGNKLTFKNVRSKNIFQVSQSLLPVIYGLFAGYVITFLSIWILGYEFASVNAIALVLSIGIIAFTYLILATLVWLKLPALIIYVLLMFFGLPLIQLAPEMIPQFYQSYVLPWLPMRFLIESMKDVLYFSKEIFNINTIILLAIAGVSLIVLWIKNLTTKIEPVAVEEIAE